MKARTPGTGSAENAREVTNDREASSNHVTTWPPCPASPIALRGFSDSDTTRAPGRCARSWSASVGTTTRFALFPDAAGRP